MDVNCNMNITGNLNVDGEIVLPVVRIFSTGSTTQSVPSSSTAAILNFNSDTLTNWPTRGSVSAFVAPVAGTYSINLAAGFSSGAASNRVIYKNGTIISETGSAGAYMPNVYNLSWLVSMNGTTDTLTFGISQTSGSSAVTGGVLDTGLQMNQVTIDRSHA